MVYSRPLSLRHSHSASVVRFWQFLHSGMFAHLLERTVAESFEWQTMSSWFVVVAVIAYIEDDELPVSCTHITMPIGCKCVCTQYA